MSRFSQIKKTSQMISITLNYFYIPPCPNIIEMYLAKSRNAILSRLIRIFDLEINKMPLERDRELILMVLGFSISITGLPMMKKITRA